MPLRGQSYEPPSRSKLRTVPLEVLSDHLTTSESIYSGYGPAASAIF